MGRQGVFFECSHNGSKNPQTQENLFREPITISFLIHRYISTESNNLQWRQLRPVLHLESHFEDYRVFTGESFSHDNVPAVWTSTNLGNMFRYHDSRPCNHRSQCRWSNVDIKLCCHTDCCLRSWKGLKNRRTPRKNSGANFKWSGDLTELTELIIVLAVCPACFKLLFEMSWTRFLPSQSYLDYSKFIC